MDRNEWFSRGTTAAEEIACASERGLRREKKEVKFLCREIWRVCAQLSREEQLSGADRWLVENQYLIAQAKAAVLEAFSQRGTLPAQDEAQGKPRVILLSVAMLAAGEPLDRRAVSAFLRGCQSLCPLREAELRALPGALRYVLLKEIARTLPEREEQKKEEDARFAIQSLRALDDINFNELLEEVSGVHQVLLRDADGTYPGMDPRSRYQYRRQVERLAKRCGEEEPALAQRMLQAAGDRHVGFVLFREQKGRGAVEQLYYPVLLVLSAALSLGMGFSSRAVWCALLLWIPTFFLLRTIADRVLARLISARPTFVMELEEGIPGDAVTLLVKAVLLSEDETANVRKLEEIYLANRDCGEHLLLGLLVDFPERERPVNQSDRDTLGALEEAVKKLNRDGADRFFLFYRMPVYQSQNHHYNGWERKRGALMELAAFLRDEESGIEVCGGDHTRLAAVKYLTVLDSDTRTGVGTIRPLVGAMLHPCNRPVIDENRGCVVSGYGIIQPQLRTSLHSAQKNRFNRLFAGNIGQEMYQGSGSELGYDISGKATFSGKGIIDVDAYLTCLRDQFPEQRVLSHDLLEGAYLRTGFLSQVSFSDDFPGTIRGYYKRQNRWVRGDWQNLPWLGSRVRNRWGHRVPNVLPAWSRWKIADNLFRSMQPIAETLCLSLGIWLHLPWLGWAALASIVSRLIVRILDRRTVVYAFRKFHSGTWSELGSGIFATGLYLLLLPLEGWTNLRAILQALWRSFVSHQNLLQWTAASTVVRSSRIILVLPLLAAGALLLLSGSPLGIILGVVWLLTPLALQFLSREPGVLKLRSSERSFLFHEAEQIWGYFSDFLTPNRNYLPPDNYQIRPYQGVAERTSPTNIGFALLSCLAAIDLELEPKETVLPRIRGMLDTMEGMERWNGNFFNWYETRNGQPMQPRVVSSVDSGNLCASLFALSTGLEELEESELAERARSMAEATRLDCLFDREKRLFYIAYDLDQQEFSPAHYDLMASEARLLSYVALAMGQVDTKHWRALSRAILTADHYQGMASWFGTMFEYFMPHLLLPLYEDSLLYESLAFCACEQMREGQRKKIPWGSSESGVPDLDTNGCYGYRANGVPSLALCGTVSHRRVVAPYATYLALSLLPHRAVENLQRLHRDGLAGKYGLYEAAEYVGGSPVPVKSWMVHHLGMSLLALDNALTDRIMVRRLMAIPAMAAYSSLLEEEIPKTAKPMDLKKVKPVAVKEETGASWRQEGAGYSEQHPVCTLLAGGPLTVRVTNNGGVWLSSEQIELVPHRSVPTLYLKTGDTVEQLFPCADGAAVKWEFTSDAAVLCLSGGRWEAELRLAFNGTEELEYQATLAARDGGLEGTLIFVLVPQMAEQREFLAHPAFTSLMVDAKATGTGVVFHRRSQEERYPDLFCGWREPRPVSRCGPAAKRRELALGVMTERQSLCLEWPVGLSAGHSRSYSVTLSASQPAPEKRTEVKAEQIPPHLRDSISAILPEIMYPRHRQDSGGAGPQRLLWPYGISGDDPILLAEDTAHLEQWIAVHGLLRKLGIRFDLVILAEQPEEWKEQLGGQTAFGGHAGVHVLPNQEECRTLLTGMCCAELDRLEPPGTAAEQRGVIPRWNAAPSVEPQVEWREEEVHLLCRGRLPAVRWSIPLTNGDLGYLGLDSGGGFAWSGNARMFQITPWTNEPYCQWGPESLEAELDGQRISLFAKQDGMDCEVVYGAGYIRWNKTTNQGRSSSVAAYVPFGRNARVFRIQCSGLSQGAALIWRMVPRMGEYRRQRDWVQSRQVNDRCVELRNPVTERGGIFLTSSVPFHEVCLPDGRRHEIELRLPLEGDVVLQLGEVADSMEPAEGERLLEQTRETWRERCGMIRPRTPDKGMDHYLGFWAQYQVQACRLMARTSVYQCGGAYGFRDQLQDCCALLPWQPEVVRRHILDCCGHQFEEGDVLHWWHVNPGANDAGVRTHISDDLLWLPYVVSVWVEELGDIALLEEQAPYLIGDKPAKGEKDLYLEWHSSGLQESVYLHCVRAIECVLGRGVGAHGLCLMGGGDWNDGMNQAGAAGLGESVWLTWFTVIVLERFASVCGQMGESRQAKRYTGLARRLRDAGEQAWDGAWFLRGYFDSGVSLGGQNSAECRIDSVAQSFAVFAGCRRDHAVQAMESAERMLFDEEAMTCRLLAPPFRFKGEYPGYISHYRPGARENGGQYTHAAVWLAKAWFALGEPDRGYRLLRSLLPEHHNPQIYCGEPFVLAADVLMERGAEGEAGWTWYTGAAGWYYRVAVQDMLGIRFRGGLLFLEPNLPTAWPGYTCELRLKDCRLEVKVTRGTQAQLRLDGQEHPQGIDLRPLSGTHTVEVEIL